MASSEGNQKPTKEIPRVKKKGGDEEAKEQPIEMKERKGPKDVGSKKDGKIVEVTKKPPRKDGKQDEIGSLGEEILLEQPNVEPEEAKELVPLHQLCNSCDEVNRRWPPPSFVDPNPRDPTLLYPGDEDPEFQPSRGDILIIHPGLHMGLIDLHRQLPKDGFVTSYDGMPSFEFALGDLVLRVGTYDRITMIADKTKQETSRLATGEKGSPKKMEEKNKKSLGKGKKDEEKKGGPKSKLMGKTSEQNKDEDVVEKPKFTYNPFEKLELYTCSGFITVEEQARLEVERLAMEAEKEKLENEAKKKGPKGRKDKKIKENVEGGGKKKSQGVDVKKNDTKGNTSGKLEAPKNIQKEIPEELAVVTEPCPKPKWRYLGSQMRLDNRSQNFLGKQCPGLTYFYRRYMRAGTRCDMHSLAPLLGEILINIGWLNNWYRNLENWQKEENKYKSLVKWSRPGLPNKGELIPGMILLRPFVGREHNKWAGWGLDGKTLPPPLPPQLVIPKEDNILVKGPNEVEEVIVPPSKCDCHRKCPCPKSPCPCHLYDPCPKLPDCGCIYCNPLPRKPKLPPSAEKTGVEVKIDENGGEGKGKNKEKGGENIKDQKSAKESKRGGKDGNDMKPNDKKMKSKDPKGPAKSVKLKGKDENYSKLKDEETPDDPKEEVEVSIKPYVWGAVEMYIFYGEDEGWEYWGRSDRICDTPYPLPSEYAKPKFLRVDDCLEEAETIEEKIGVGEESLEEMGNNDVVENSIDKDAKNIEHNVLKKQSQKEDSTKKSKKKT